LRRGVAGGGGGPSKQQQQQQACSGRHGQSQVTSHWRQHIVYFKWREPLTSILNVVTHQSHHEGDGACAHGRLLQMRGGGGGGGGGAGGGLKKFKTPNDPICQNPVCERKHPPRGPSRAKAEHCRHPMRQPLLGHSVGPANTENAENTADPRLSEHGVGVACAPVMRRSRSMRDLLEPDRPGGSPRIFKACMPMYLALFLPPFQFMMRSCQTCATDTSLLSSSLSFSSLSS
jgi:hypothetical protein